MNFVDRIEIAGTRRRDDGSLVVDARVARTGIQLYAGYEVGKPEIPVVRVHRAADEVFSTASMASFAHRPVTNDHPPEMVTADNWAKYAKGGTSAEIARDGEYIRVPLLISDASTIADVESGKRELSSGYVCDLEWTPGKTANGETFDASQRNIRANHVAIVDHGRAGSNVRIGDQAKFWGSSPIIIQTKDGKTMETPTKTIHLADGLPILVTDQAEAVIRRFEKMVADAATAAAALTATHTAALAAKDTEIGRLTGELAKIKDSAPKPADITKLVMDRAVLLGTAAKLVKDFKPETFAALDADAIRRAVVIAKFGEAVVKDKSNDVVAGMYEIAARDASTGSSPTDPFRSAIADAGPIADNSARAPQAAAYQKMLDTLTGAHLPPKAN